MKWRELWHESVEGRKEAERLGLDDEANWTPLLTYVHVTRMFLGLVFGFAIGALCTTLVFLLRFMP